MMIEKREGRVPDNAFTKGVETLVDTIATRMDTRE